MKFPIALRDDLYADPARIYAEAEARTCKGCVWICTYRTLTDEMLEHCAKGEKFGRRCAHYSERLAGTCYCLKCRKITQVFGSNWCAECYYPGIDRDWRERKKP